MAETGVVRRRSGGPEPDGELEQVVRLAGRVLEGPETVEKRRGARLESLEQLQRVAEALGRDPRAVERAGGGREERGEALEAPPETPPGAPPQLPPGFRARGKGSPEGRGETPPPVGHALRQPRDLRRVDAEGGELVREDRPKEALVPGPLREERSTDLLGAERREAPAKVPRRDPERVAVLRFREAAKEAAGRLEAPQGDPDVVDERRVAPAPGPLPELAQVRAPRLERVLQDREDRAGSSVRQGGPPPRIVGLRWDDGPQPASPDRPGSSSDGWPTW